ncbi:aspartate aminotransferase, partial [Staphylococcus pseudintermedius]
YNLVYGLRHQAPMQTYLIFDAQGHFTIEHLVKTLDQFEEDKVIMLLNYRNNATSYTHTSDEVESLIQASYLLSNLIVNVVAVVDETYHGLVYEYVYTQSI